MASNVSEWLNLALRWFHVIAGISWIGSSFYFMWLDSHIEPPATPDESLAGSLWMVHSGGFYRVEKRYLKAGQVPANLHWFKWEAAFTWMSGIALLVLVYHLGGIAVDSGVSDLSEGAAAALAIGLLLIAWTAYDLFYLSPMAKHPKVAALVGYLAVVAIAWFLSPRFGGRSTYMHVGAMLGTLMVANVWMRILPAQRQMIAATQAGQPADRTLGERAKARSVHNNYMTLPVVFIMVSNHFPSTYGNRWNWLVLGVLILAGAGVRHHLNVQSAASRWLAIGAVASLAVLCYLTA